MTATEGKQFKCPICGGPKRGDHSLVDDDRYRGNPEHQLEIEADDGTVRVWSGWELCACCWYDKWECCRRDKWGLTKVHGAGRLAKMAYMLSLDYTQTEIAREIGVHRNTIRAWKKKLSENPNLIVHFEASRVRTG